jgi:Tfp pilus assembly protein PilE
MMRIRTRQQGQRGFNLIEAAIVLGIVGLIVGGIWVAAAAVYENLRTGRGTQQLLQTAQAIRSLHASQTTITTGDITASMAAAKALPSDMVVDTTPLTAVNPWQGAVLVVGVATAGTSGGPGYWIIFNGLPTSACIDLAVRNSGQGRDAGLEAVSLAATAQSTLAGNAGSAPPTTVATAAAACTAATSINSAAFLFRLRS